MSVTTTYLGWCHGSDTVALIVGRRRVPANAAVSALLLEINPRALTEDPATDLLLLEQDLRLENTRLASQLATAAAEVDIARVGVADAESATGWAGRRVRQAAGEHLAEAIAEHTHLTAARRSALDAVAAIRDFVTDAAVPDGWLAEAAAGWQRDPEPPTWVTVFDSETFFLDCDARRCVPGWWGGSALGGVHVGYEWRRDGDDEDPMNSGGLLRAGPWWLAWLATTGEIYATRRSAYLPGQVWLLGSGFDTADAAMATLTEAEPLMRQPNSLIAAAQIVHDHALTAASGEHHLEHHPPSDVT